MSAGGAYRLQLLGESVRLDRCGDPVRLDTRAALLLAYLALAGPTSRERLAALLWPDADTSRARGNLRQLLVRLRRVAPIVREAPVHLDPAVWVDVRSVLDDPIGEVQAGGLLTGVDAAFSLTLEEWLHAERTRFAHTVQARLTERRLDAVAGGRLAPRRSGGSRRSCPPRWPGERKPAAGCARVRPCCASRRARRGRRWSGGPSW